jgi:hypothetical protein
VDLVTRLSLGLGRTRHQAGAVTHLSHGDEKRMTARGGKAQTEARNRDLALASYAAGDLTGTYETDLATWADQVRTYR